MPQLNTSKTRILVVEDHPATRASLVNCLQNQPGWEICGQTDSWRDALAMIQIARPDLVLLDLQLTDGHGWALLYEVAGKPQAPRVLVYSVFDENLHAARLLRAGAAGYLTKEAPLEEVVAAVHKVLAGHLVASESMTSQFIRQAVGRETETPEERLKRESEELSDRELQVFELISRGLTNKQIAGLLDIGATTIGSYKTRLMRKLGVSNQLDLVRAARERLLTASHPLHKPLPTIPPEPAQ